MTLLNVTARDYTFENIKLHNPSMLEIADKIDDEEDFLFALKVLSSSLLDMMTIDIPHNFSNFDLFLGLLIDQKEIQKIFSQNKLSAINNLLQLIFLDYKISIGQEEVIFNKENNFIVLNSNNFTTFQNIVQSMFKTSFLFGGDGNHDDYNPGSEEARRIAEKLRKGKQKVAELKGQMNNKTAVIENYIIMVSVGLHLSPNEISQLTLYQILTLFERVKMKIEWDLDIDCRLAGGTPDEHPDNWMSII